MDLSLGFFFFVVVVDSYTFDRKSVCLIIVLFLCQLVMQKHVLCSSLSISSSEETVISVELTSRSFINAFCANGNVFERSSQMEGGSFLTDSKMDFSSCPMREMSKSKQNENRLMQSSRSQT